MRPDRLALARLVATPSGTLTVRGPVDLAEYARFKHGDGCIAHQYGTALAEAFAATLHPSIVRVKVTSSAFGFVPPAAHALLGPFVTRLRQITDLHLERFKVDRLTVTNGDYATMPIAQRKAALGAGSLLVDPQVSLDGEYVLAVDDVRVTGTHEVVMNEALTGAGAAKVQHLYVVDAWECRYDPEAESVINAASVRAVRDLIALTTQVHFVPNARFCKRVIALPEADLARFLDATTPAVVHWIAEAVESDRLDQYSGYAEGCRRFQGLLAMYS